ncbi:hypothetical protein HC931_28350, partial [Candidatus Gracilibacteria bacterium]|nr:hypothetical protein [Candidatus Gracilibacteria bacterium]
LVPPAMVKPNLWIWCKTKASKLAEATVDETGSSRFIGEYVTLAIYERMATLREVGAGVALWANATHVLKKLDVLEEALSEGDRVTNYQFFSQKGKELMNLRVDGFEVPAIAIHRADLQALLWRKLPLEQTTLGQSFERFEQFGDKVSSHFSSSLTDEGDALIGADGLRSRVRSQLFGDAKPIYRGMTAYRGLTNNIPNTYKPGYIYEFLGAGKGFGFVTIKTKKSKFIYRQKGGCSRKK